MKPKRKNVEEDFEDLKLSAKILDKIFQGQRDAYNSGASDGYEDGYDDATDELSDELTDEQKEEIGCNYAVDQFSEIENFEDFKSKLAEINNRALNYQRPIGL